VKNDIHDQSKVSFVIGQVDVGTNLLERCRHSLRPITNLNNIIFGKNFLLWSSVLLYRFRMLLEPWND